MMCFTHSEGQLRPITLLSALYRNWARLRTKQMVHQLSKVMPPEALGFLPAREAAQVWLNLQAQIELMMQQNQNYSGLSTDLKKAFNHIGRRQVFKVAERLGMPEPLLNARQKFLGGVARRFDVHGDLGLEIASSSGFPEGDPLSIIAMLVVDWSYHTYMRVFCPKVSAYSFVDNLTLAAREALHVAHAYFALRTICQLFGLSTDTEKTYVWALSSPERQRLMQLQFPCLFDASELGGPITFGAARRNRVPRARGEKLETKWERLRCSRAPQLQKYNVLPVSPRFFGHRHCMVPTTAALLTHMPWLSGVQQSRQLELAVLDQTQCYA